MPHLCIVPEAPPPSSELKEDPKACQDGPVRPIMTLRAAWGWLEVDLDRIIGELQKVSTNEERIVVVKYWRLRARATSAHLIHRYTTRPDNFRQVAEAIAVVEFYSHQFISRRR